MSKAPHTNGDTRTRPGLPLGIRVAILLVQLLAVVAVVLGALQIDAVRERLGIEVELRGSTPPVDRILPDLSKIEDIKPPLPAPADDRGRAAMWVFTCGTCRSGDVVGGFLRRLQTQDLPDGSQVRVVVWGANAAEFAQTHDLGEDRRFVIHYVQTPKAQREAQRITKVGESGITMVVGPSGKGGSTFHLGQLNIDDIRHDLRFAE